MSSQVLKLSICQIFIELYTYAEFWFGNRVRVEGTVTQLFKEYYHTSDKDYREFRLCAIKHMVALSAQEDSHCSKQESNRKSVKESVKNLPMKYKIPLLLQIKGRFCRADIANILNISQMEVDERLFIGKTILRNKKIDSKM
ncbi:DNA-directed RNA polymerase specialized sigma24 family protein [Aeromonas sp. BIGb0405]|uniref:hypothetical protein n=1 Tax=unclassified Aeromonas TaxID=257493 RepID=UPI0021697022|nr:MULTISPECIES: hypothetical protein [unclassified Aeromonas]MCS3455880.1 DNA-directed RNA polymerase specialized sigma24 family protein [Aeromonas sp. BIGb0405]MCS3459000.1 DNA-directed RNA polymerase specialized sigma24 family protein [Aeromonas sp. BIGb0445]